MYTSWSQKRIIKGVKFHLQNFDGLALTLLKSCYLTAIIWYARLAPTRRKCFIVCECVSSHPANPQMIDESRHKNGNLIRKWACNTMIFIPEHGSVNTNNQFLTPRRMQCQPILPKYQYSLMSLLQKCGTHQKSHKVFPRKFSSNGTIMWRNTRIPTWKPTWRQDLNNCTVVQPAPAVRNTTYVTTLNLIAMKITDINLWAELVCSTERSRRRSRNSRNASRSLYVGVQSFGCILFRLFRGD